MHLRSGKPSVVSPFAKQNEIQNLPGRKASATMKTRIRLHGGYQRSLTHLLSSEINQKKRPKLKTAVTGYL